MQFTIFTGGGGGWLLSTVGSSSPIEIHFFLQWNILGPITDKQESIHKTHGIIDTCKGNRNTFTFCTGRGPLFFSVVFICPYPPARPPPQLYLSNFYMINTEKKRVGKREWLEPEYDCKNRGSLSTLKVHKIENFFVSDFGICVISLLVMYK